MYISPRVSIVRNILVSFFNGGITLVILLIAPLGLAAVIINTLLVAVTTYVVSSVADGAIAWLEQSEEAELISPSKPRGKSINRYLRHSLLGRRRR